MTIAAGDTKWLMANNKPIEGVVDLVHESTNTDSGGTTQETTYRMKTGEGFNLKMHGFFLEGELFDSKRGLIASL